ncbi:MAG TPA: N-acetylmuramoyl-L-alanine amidase [Candidatus Alistipes avicola]|uniref:N-acetylmuramoyl-L-alanine amidase n=1 Tax=Candidatus Alistipes avicola TaxID=2838432 RepID=A0A9D2RHN6_9BACT|nr:N-acetylmuramoyl-L-alanine amidase [uncultured Alistipes sp.]HJA99166.1 N-acetylmuramoyl-L-alanine amidase [Candidatus Alistipes avicola]
MRKSLFTLLLFALIALFPNGAMAENIAQGVRVIVIDAGHGGPKFPGASYKSVYEKDLNLQIALKLGALIEKHLPQIKVVYTRKTDKQFSESLTKDLQARADIANKASGDLFISIHTNAAQSRSARGVETLIMGETPLEKNANERALYDNNQEELIDMSNEKTAAIVRAYIQNLQFTYGEYSEAMARLVQKHYVKSGRHNRGVKRQPLKVLYATDMPGILTEIGFLSNDEERAYMTSEKGQAAIAQALFNAVKDYTEFVQGTLLVEGDAIYEQADPEETEGKSGQTVAQAETFYAVQLIASTKPVSLKDRQFKSYRGKVEQYTTSGRFKYKYCVGRFTDRKQAEKKLAEVKKEFKDAFIVRCEGTRIVP